jgi:DNA-binding transcriptional ArsR family regulator
VSATATAGPRRRSQSRRAEPPSGRICHGCNPGALVRITLPLESGGSAELSLCNICELRTWRIGGRIVPAADVLGQLATIRRIPWGTAAAITKLDSNDAVFSALAHESRRTILSMLHGRGGEMSSGAIASVLECSWPTTTRHLRVLQEAGLVRVELRGRRRAYRLDVGRLRAVAGAWIDRFDQPRSFTKEVAPSSS